MAVAAFSGGPAGCPLASGPVAGQRDDFGDQGLDLAFRAGGTMPAVRAAGVGGDVVADEGEHRGERDELRGGPGLCGGAAAAVATMLWTSSRPQASCLASSGDWPRSGRREPRTVFFK